MKCVKPDRCDPPIMLHLVASIAELHVSVAEPHVALVGMPVASKGDAQPVDTDTAVETEMYMTVLWISIALSMKRRGVSVGKKDGQCGHGPEITTTILSMTDTM